MPESYEPELGQALFGGPWEENMTPPYVTSGLDVIAERIAEWRGCDQLLVANDGEPEFINDVFAMRSYCWCDGESHPAGCPPNFESNGYAARWYKHSHRGQSINSVPGVSEWAQILTACLQSIPEGTHKHDRVPKDHQWANENPGFADYWECVCGAYGFGATQYGART